MHCVTITKTTRSSVQPALSSPGLLPSAAPQSDVPVISAYRARNSCAEKLTSPITVISRPVITARRVERQQSRLPTLIAGATRPAASPAILILFYLATVELIEARSRRRKSDHPKQEIHGAALLITELQSELASPATCLVNSRSVWNADVVTFVLRQK